MASKVSGRLWERFPPLTGAVAVILTVVGTSLGDPYRSGLDPDPTDPSSVVAQALTKIREDARTGVLLGLIGMFFLIWFVSYLREYLRSFEGEAAWMSLVAYGGGLIGIVLLLVSFAATLAATEIIAYGDDTVIAKVFLTFGWNYFYVVSPPLMALVAASSLVALRFGALPRWLAVLGLVILVVPFFVGAGLGAVLGLMWILLASVVLTFTRYGRRLSGDQV
jgi:hypothetical protein